ncbi:phosphoribosyl-AMP cyclohydrolase [Convivina intestini]|uniref:Phosphoribosyl-AMP cyclohydrolase n=1 Tax=Convivina intestini TaxID=1505726 RepID=A0A2U1DCD9_9LACO|nr:phosphoribosyl-AMP cyclohydrolase [Convivina intestini]CAH1852961.1 Phosphoribosyl-AMP cyclohydrolase [Convivina intestini]SDB86027.1 phosphoribosyl-AMP cyclohydrolase [Leuconostocaceae bacterium R-53105]
MIAPDFNKQGQDGLIPAIVVDDRNNEVLMLAYMNQASYQKTLATGQTWFWSRSRQAFWHKGATSGNYQQVVQVMLDCDQDTLLIRVIPQGPACHTGARTCFFTPVMDSQKEA